MASSAGSRTGVTAILAGVLIFAGQAGQLAFGNALGPLWVALWVLGVAAFVVAIWGLGSLVTTKTGRIGWRVCVAGVVLVGLFAVQTLITVAFTGDIPENFILFGLGFLLLFVGHVLIATGLRDALGRAWILPLVGAAGILVAITLNGIDPIHDIGLFVFEGAWVALGIVLLRTETTAEAGPCVGSGLTARARALVLYAPNPASASFVVAASRASSATAPPPSRVQEPSRVPSVRARRSHDVATLPSSVVFLENRKPRVSGAFR